ncbi:amidohydrolase family protein [Candidatus Woesearchaeota archaeon]|nr:amidohydrolase family protein [Candidatus Woesearchaeota archaeon]
MHRFFKYSITSENIEAYEQIFENANIFDCHTHIGVDKDKHYLTAEMLVKSMKDSNVNKAVIFPFNGLTDSYSNFRKANEVILKASARHPEKFIPFFRLDPHKEWKKEFNLRVRQGFRGIKLHPRSQNFPITFSKALDIYDACQQNNLVLLIHAGFGIESAAEDLLSISRSFSDLGIIVGHSGFLDLENVITKLGGRKNIFFDTSTLRIFDLFELLKKVNYRKISFGSDIPYYDIDLALEGLVDSAIMVSKPVQQIRAILGENISRWFD